MRYYFESIDFCHVIFFFFFFFWNRRMLKHVQSTGGRSACSTPVMGKARHTRSPSCSTMSSSGTSTSLQGTASLMRARRQSDIPAASHSRNSSTSSLFTSLAANLFTKAAASRRCSARWSMDCDCATCCSSEDKSSRARAGASTSTLSKQETDSVGPLTLSAASSYTSLNHLVSSPNSSFDSSSTSSSLSPGTSMVSTFSKR